MFSRGRFLLRVVAGALLALAFSGCTPSSQSAPAPGEIPSAPPMGSGPGQTDVPFYFVTGGEGVPFDSQPIPWDDGREAVGLVTEAADLDDLEAARFPFVEGASTAVAFLAPPGEERNPDSWKLWSDTVPLEAGQGVWFPTVTPYKLMNGDQEATRKAGGAYSLGVAYLDSSGREVVAAFFGAVNVTPGTGDFTFSTPTG